jgi:hypothetical protein
VAAVTYRMHGDENSADFISRIKHGIKDTPTPSAWDESEGAELADMLQSQTGEDR